MNKWIGIGRLTKDPDVRYSAHTQKAVARFTLAIDDGYGENKKTNFISIIAFGKTAEACEKFTGKGLRCSVEGKISTGSYEKDGQKHYTTDVIADRVEFIDWKGKSESERAAAAPLAEDQSGVPEGFSALDCDDLPF